MSLKSELVDKQTRCWHKFLSTIDRGERQYTLAFLRRRNLQFLPPAAAASQQSLPNTRHSSEAINALALMKT